MMESGYLGNPKLKRVGVKDSFTEEQALEIASPYLGILEGRWATWPNSSLKQSTINNPWQLSEFLVNSL